MSAAGAVNDRASAPLSMPGSTRPRRRQRIGRSCRRRVQSRRWSRCGERAGERQAERAEFAQPQWEAPDLCQAPSRSARPAAMRGIAEHPSRLDALIGSPPRRRGEGFSSSARCDSSNWSRRRSSRASNAKIGGRCARVSGSGRAFTSTLSLNVEGARDDAKRRFWRSEQAPNCRDRHYEERSDEAIQRTWALTFPGIAALRSQ